MPSNSMLLLLPSVTLPTILRSILCKVRTNQYYVYGLLKRPPDVNKLSVLYVQEHAKEGHRLRSTPLVPVSPLCHCVNLPSSQHEKHAR